MNADRAYDDRPEHGGLAARPKANFPRKFRRDVLRGRLAHQAKGLLDLAVGDNIKEWRLIQLNRESLL